MGTSIFHITLIQPRYIKENDIPDIKSKITEILSKNKFTSEDTKVFFDTLVIDQESDEKYVFMLNARKNEALINIQKELLTSLQNYQNYYDDANREYEIHFHPHLSIGVNIDESQKKEVEKYFSSDYVCEGEISELVLPIVKDRSVEEADNSKNLTIFNL